MTNLFCLRLRGCSYFANITGSHDYDNFLRTYAPSAFGNYARFLSQPSVAKAIHVGSHGLQSGMPCEMHLLSDFMVSLKPQFATLLDNVKVLIYNGQLDIIIGAPLTEAFLPTVQWSGQSAYQSAERVVWKQNATAMQVSGYARSVKSFTQVVVGGAGRK